MQNIPLTFQKKLRKSTKILLIFSRSTSIFSNFPPKINGNIGINQVVKYVQTSQYIGEFERLISSSPIVLGEFRLIFSYAVMLIWREFLEFSSFWREIQLTLERAGEANGEFETHTI